MIDEMDPVNEDEEGYLYLQSFQMTGTLEELDVERLDDNTLVTCKWRNATLTMRAGSLKAVAEEMF